MIQRHPLAIYNLVSETFVIDDKFELKMNYKQRTIRTSRRTGMLPTVGNKRK